MDLNAQAALLDDLERVFHQLEGHYSKLDSRIEGQIVRWRYAKRRAFTLRSEHLRRTNITPGKLIDEEPTQEIWYYAYGYDAQGRIVNESDFRTDALPIQCTFFEYHDGYTDLAEFKKHPMTEKYRLTCVGRLVHPDPAKPTHYAEYGEMPNGRMMHTFERYEYDAQGRLLRVRVIDARGETRTVEAFTYDGDRLVRIEDNTPSLTGETEPLLLYEAPRAGESYKLMRDAARASLRQAIIDGVQGFDRTRAKDPRMFSMVISDMIMDYESVSVFLCPQSQREGWGSSCLYADHEFREREAAYFKIDPLPEAFQRYERRVESEERWEDHDTLIQRIARDLNDHDWSTVFEPTDDFIVFVMEQRIESHEEFEESLIASIPKEKRELLRKRGYLE